MEEQQYVSHNQIEDEVEVTGNLVNKCENPLISTEHSYNQALVLTGNGKFQIVILLVTGVCLMSVIMEAQCISYILPTAKCDMNMSTTEQGFINSVGYLGVIFSSHFWGFMADTWGRRKVIRTALLLAFVMSLFSSFSLNSWMLMITRFAIGLCMAGVHATVMAYLGEMMSDKNRPRYIAFAVSFMSLGFTMMPTLGWLVLTRSFEWSFFNGWFVYKPWRVFLFINSFITGFGALGMMLLPESPKFQLAMKKPSEALAILSKMYACNTGNPKEKFPVQSIAALDATVTNLSDVAGVQGALLLVWNQTKSVFYPPHLYNVLMMCCTFFAIYFVIHGQQFWYPQILSYYSMNINMPATMCEIISLGHSAEIASTRNVINVMNSTTIPDDLVNCNVIINPLTFKVSVTVGICLLIFNILLGFAVKQFDTRSILTWLLALNTISVLAIIWTNHFYVTNFFMLILILTNICCCILVGVYGDLFPTHIRAMSLNMIIMFGRLGSVSGINFVAAMIFRFCDTLYYINFLLMMGAVGVTYILLWKRKGATSV